MSIRILRDKPGMKGITMRYEEGGKVQVFSLNGKEVRLGPNATDEEIQTAFEPKDEK